ncbi:MAG: hypothetical protein JWM90_47 [Thermoleophilia bacterium]|nr:hypothetical protein [Thermoleophilia bacterium]
MRLWGGLIADAAEHVPHGAGPVLSPIDDALKLLRPLDEGQIRTTGWEMAHTLLPDNDSTCLEKSVMTGMALAERITGSIPAALQNIGASDARVAASAVAYRVQVGGLENNFHLATLARTTDDKLLVIDRHLADSPDGVMMFDDWLAKVGGRREDTRIVPLTHIAPNSNRSNAGIPPIAKRIDAPMWREITNNLAARIEIAAQRNARPAP